MSANRQEIAKRVCTKCLALKDGEFIKSPDGLKQRYYCTDCIERHDLHGVGAARVFAVPLPKRNVFAPPPPSAARRWRVG